MTVSTEISREEYTGNGVTTDFDYRFRVFSADELVVTVADTTENISTLTLNTNYTVTGAGSRNGGKVKLLDPLAVDWRISIERYLPVTQETDVRNQGNFFPEVHEDAFDKLTMLIQQALGVFGLSLRKPNWLAKYYDAQGNRIINLGEPVNSNDAATKNYVDAVGDGLFKKTLRFPENVEPMPSTSVRGHSLQGYTAEGKPVPVFSMTDTADLALKLASEAGATLVGIAGGGTVQSFIDNMPFVTPEMFGAVHDGVTDDRGAIQAAINTGRDIQFLRSAQYFVGDTLIFRADSGQQMLNGNGCVIKWTQETKQIFDQYDGNGGLLGYANRKSFSDFTFTGPATAKRRYQDVIGCYALPFANGTATDINVYGFTNAFRVFGNTRVERCHADQLRNTVWSERNNNNLISNVTFGWVAGDVLVMYSKFFTARGINGSYAGVLPPDTEENLSSVPPPPRGSLISTGQDGNAANCKYGIISDIKCIYHGGGGVIIQGESIIVDGAIDIGDLYLSTARNDVPSRGIWVQGNKLTIGNIRMGAVNNAVTIQSGASLVSIGDVFVDSQLVGSNPSLLSAFDAGSSTIFRCNIRSIHHEGFVNSANLVLIVSSGITLDRLYVRSHGNLYGTRTILVRGNSTIGLVNVNNPSDSSAPGTVLELEGQPIIGEIVMQSIYGTCINIVSGSTPKIGDVFLKQLGNGGLPPIIINGTGSENHFWGSVHLNGALGARPRVTGTLSMSSFYSPIEWQSNDPAKTAVVKFPPPTIFNLNA